MEASGEVKLLQFLECLGEPYLFLDPAWQCTHIDPHLAATWQRSPEMIVGKDFWEAVPALVHTDFHQRALRAVAEHHIIHLKFYDPLSRGWFEVRFCPLPQGLICLLRNIDAYMQIEQELREKEAQQRLLAELGEIFNRITNTDALLGAVTQMISEYFRVRRCLFVEVNVELDEAFIRYEYSQDEFLSKGKYRVSDYSPVTRRDMEAGVTVVNCDAREDARTAAIYESVYARNQERAYIAVPLLREGRWVGELWVSQPEPRLWTEDEVALLKTIADRVWLAVENSRYAAALLGSQERFSKAFFATPLILTITSLKTGKLLEVNETFTEVTGITRAEAIGRTTLELGLWAEAEDRKAELSFVKNRGSARNLEYRFNGRNGQVLVGLLSAELLEMDGESCALTVIADITERKRTEERLRQNEQKLRIAIEAAQISTWEYHRDGTRILGEKYAEVVGCAPASGEDFLGIVHPEDRERFVGVVNQTLLTGEPYQQEYRIILPSGEERWLAGYGQLISGSSEQPDYMMGVVMNITARKKNEEILRSSEERLRLVTDQASVYLAYCDRDTRLLFVNQRYAERFGLTREECLGKRIPEVVGARAYESFRQYVEAALAGQSVEFETEVPYEKLGTRYMHCAYVPEFDEHQQVRAFIGVLTDVTERKHLEREREHLLTQERRLREQAEAHNRAKDEFLSVVSHELRSPLNSIFGYTQILRMHPDNPSQVAATCEIIERNSKMQLRIIEDLLDTARIISGKMRIEPRPVDLISVLNAALDVVRPTAEARQVKLKAVYRPLPQLVLGDPNRLQQVVWNLLQNAIKFTPAGGDVELDLRPIEDRIEVIVRDSGEGIAAEFLPHIFDRFTQADASRTRRYGGLGLGLALVKQLVELHGGTITAASAGIGQGATFTVRLPLQAGPAEFFTRLAGSGVGAEVRTGQEALPLDRAPSLQGRCVLIVDDQDASRSLLSMTLEQFGAEVISAASGREALSFLTQLERWPDVIILDIAMPEEDGYAVLQKLRALETFPGLPPNTYLPAIALTSFAAPEDRLRALAAGFEMQLAKPVDPVELAVVINSLVGKQRRRL